MAERMITWMTYGEIQSYKRKGFNKSQIARILEIDYKTILKYWNMNPEEFLVQKEYAQTRIKKAEKHEEFIVSSLKQYPNVTAAQIYDWIKEKTEKEKLSFTERTLRNFVAEIRKKYQISKNKEDRQYEAVEDPPFGLQSQIDMGEITLLTENGKYKKLYCFAMVLSNSRIKFAHWQEKPFAAETFVRAHLKAFEYMGGRTKELVYDQDKVLAVSENNGDIIYTDTFQSFIDEFNLNIYLCRKSDPESKGKVEAVVKYLKNNFAKYRTFKDIYSFNQECLAWLDRTGNSKIHETTKKVPKEVFALEKQYLISVPAQKYNNSATKNISYPIRKDNIVLYKSNRYRVPKGSYQPGKRVLMNIEGEKIAITDTETGEIYATHPLCHGKGELIGQKREERDKSVSLKNLEETVLNLLEKTEESKQLLQLIHQAKPRYYRDQLGVLKKLSEKEKETKLLREAISYCLERGLHSANDLKSAVIYLKELQTPFPWKENTRTLPDFPDKYRGLAPQIRELELYEKVLGGLING